MKKKRPDDLPAAIQSGDVTRVRTLLAGGADVNRVLPYDMTPLMLAASLGLPEMVRFLLEAGADHRRKTADGWTAADLAALYGEFHMGAITPSHQEVIRIINNARRREARHLGRGKGSNPSPTDTPKKPRCFIHGLAERDWHRLKDAVLGAALGQGKKKNVWFDRLPQRLTTHPVARLIEQYLDTNKQHYLDKAAAVLTSNCATPWLYLGKS